MLFYWILFIAIFIVASYCKRKSHAFAIISTILLFLGSTRGETVGTDIYAYSLEFDSIGLNPSTWGKNMSQFELGFAWLMSRFKYYISDNSLFFFHVLFFFTFLIQLRFIKQCSKYPALSLVFMVGWAYYFSYYNIMREKLCFAFITGLIYPSIIQITNNENKFTKKNIDIVKIVGLYVFLIILISFFFHKSQILLLLILPILFWKDKKIFSNKYLIIYILVSVAFSVSLAKLMMSQFQSIAFIFQDDNSNISNYLVYEDNFEKFSQIRNIANSFFSIYIIREYQSKNRTFLLLYVFGLILANILTPISWIYQRVGNMFSFFCIIVFSELWYDIPNKNRRLIFRVILMIFTIINYQNRLINDREQDVVPYVSSIFDF